MTQETIESTQRRTPRFMRYVYLFIALLVLLLLIYGYISYGAMKAKEQKANEVMGMAEQGEILVSGIKTERTRCQSFISGERGDFGEFEYCQEFLEWARQFNIPE